MIDPFRIEGPAVISFSGGRTSGYMLWRILQAHGGGKLPEDVRVIFCNTGKEMLETLDFVQECSEQWNVPVTWIEYAGRIGKDGSHKYKVTGHRHASRSGEPFELLLDWMNTLPNVRARACTKYLKLVPMKMFVNDIGLTDWTAVIGLRNDEPSRVARLRANIKSENGADQQIAPLASAGINVAEVGEFWSRNNFDLKLENMNGVTVHGNCDLCFLKSSGKIMSLIRENQSRAIWWMKQEERFSNIGNGALFRIDRPSYKQMYDMALSQGEMFKFDDEALQDCMCTD